MGGSKKNDEESLLEAIKFYQNGLLRYMERNDEFKMSHGLNKLSSYPIRMSHLQDTGVGRTVNLLVKLDGKVGEQARSLIAKWKQMVEEEKEAQNEDTHSEDSQESLERHSDRGSKERDCESERSSSSSSSGSDEDRHKNKKSKSEKENRGSKRHRNSRESESHKSNDHRSHDSRDSKRHKSSHNTSDEQSRYHKSKSERENSRSEKSISSRLEEEHSPQNDKKHTSHHEKEHISKHEKQNSSRYEKEHTSKHEKEHSSRHEKKHSSRHSKEHSSKHEKDESKKDNNRESSKKRDENSHKTKDKNNQEEKNKKDEQRQKDNSTNKEKDNRRDKEKDKKSHREKNDSSKRERDDKYNKKENEKNNSEKDKIKEVPARRDEDKISNSAGNSKIEKVPSSKHHKTEISSESGTSFAEALGMLEMSRKEKKTHTKDNSSSKPSESVRHFGDVSRNTESKKERESDLNEKKSSSKHKKSEISSGAGTSSEKKRKSDEKEKVSSTRHSKNELSSESGTSFEEALGMMEVPKKEKKSVKKRREEIEKSNIGYEDSEICSSSGTTFEEALGMIEVPRKKKKVTDRPAVRTPSPVENENRSPILPLPSIPLEKIDVNVSLLPSITPNYKPIRILDSLHSHNETEFMDSFMKNKHHRTKIYSGNKSLYSKVPSLFDICVQLLQVHIDAIEGTGGVPYSILKPVLEKATPSQLLRLEYYNSYLTEDSDELWKLHCQKDFRNKTRQECETWREMYNRCTDEREARFLTLTASIKESKEKSVPVRTTKIAYIDPPMAGARRGVKNSAAPMAKAKVEALVRESKASSDVVVSHHRKASRTSSAPTPSTSSSQSKVKKMAPLMAKSLSAFKNRRYKN